jgi:predicted transcriptional regulator
MYSKEFFVQRSFEVVWAVFRVAEHTVRPKIKDGLEDKAVDYLLFKDMKTLDGLEELVRFCAQIKEIGAVNVNVLLREIGNLRAAMTEFEDNQRRQIVASKNPETAPKIEEVFSRPPMKVSDLLEAIKEGFRVKSEEGKQARSEEFGKYPAKLSPTTEVLEDKSLAREQESLAREPDNSSETNQSPARKKDRFEAVVGFKERNEIIMNILTKRSLCHLKDLAIALPNVSERTIRYDIQRLMDKGTVERVGTGGPNSFFRLIKEQVENKPKAV